MDNNILLEDSTLDLQSQKEAENGNFFQTDHIQANLKAQSVRGGVVTMTAQVIKFLLHIVSTVVLARLLTPRDYGLVAMVTAITGFVTMFKDMGLSMATIQRAEINHRQVSALFWINVIVGLVLALTLAVVSPIISWFYNEPRLTWITIAIAGTFIFSGLSVQHQALLRRQMRYPALAVAEIGSIVAGVIIAIIMAVCGAEYWALVGLSAVTSLSYLILVWIMCKWRPSLPARQAEVLPLVAFGGHLTGYRVINYFARNFDNILLGWFRGADVLGLYSRAYNIMMLPIGQIRNPLESVAIPALSHIQNDPIRYKRYYIKLVTLLAFLTMPLMVFLFVCADKVVMVLLGAQWLGAIDIFKILCVTAFIQPVETTWGAVLISLGQGKRYFTWGIINSIIIVISFVLGLPWGAIGVASAYTIATYVLIAPTLWYCFRRTPISVMDFCSAISRQAIASIIMGLAIFSVRPYLAGVSDIVSIGCSFIIGVLAYFSVLILVPGGLTFLRDFSSYGSLLFKKST